MNYKKLDFFTVKYSSGRDKDKRINYKGCMKILSHAAPSGSDGKVWISTRISNPIIGFDKYMMLLHCSDETHMFVAANYLKMRNVGYCPIKLSDGHRFKEGYCIITDEINTLRRIKDLINMIPGVYEAYRDNTPYISANIGGAETLEFPADYHTLSNPLVIGWLDAVKDYYKSDDIQKILKIKKMGTALRNGTIKDLMANPEFKL